MKFYKHKSSKDYLHIIIVNKLNAIYFDRGVTLFYRNGKIHNNKNAASFSFKYKGFYLSGIHYGNQDNFTKQSWRRFVKLQVFL